MRPGPFATDRLTYFNATRSELAAALPDWREPLPAPIRQRIRNPFSGEALEVMTLDPGPHVYPPVYAKVPPTLPFEHALPPNEEDWESRYLALDYALSNAPARAPEFFEYDALDDAMRPRGLVSPALLGGEEAWIWVVPSRIIAALGALEKASLASTLDGWNQRSPAQNRPEDLVALSELARNATAARRDMFLWVIPPPHRHLPGATT